MISENAPLVVVVPKVAVLGAVTICDADGNPVAASNGDYVPVAASQTEAPLGSAGAIGDVLTKVIVTPASTSPGIVEVYDGSGSAIVLFAGGSSSVSNLQPFTIDVGMRSAAGGWSLTTGANVSVVAIGDFS